MKKKTKIIFAVFIISVVCVFTACNDGSGLYMWVLRKRNGALL